MPPVIIAVAAAVAGTVVSSAVVATVGVVAAGIIGGLAGAVVAGVGSRLIGADKPKVPDFGPGGAGSFGAVGSTRALQDRTQLFTSTVAPRQVIYGKCVVSGPRVFATSSGGQNQKISVIVPVAGHEIAGIDRIRINDTWIDCTTQLNSNGFVTTGPFAGDGNVTNIRIFLGKNDQIADPVMIAENPSEWTTAHRGQGVGYFIFRTHFNQSLMPNGIVNLQAEVRGKPVLDVRTNSVAYTDNFILCALDYLRWKGIGLGIEEWQWEPSWYVAQANICDENVEVQTGVFQKRYTVNGSFLLDAKPVDILEDMFQSAGANMTTPGGKHRIHVGAYTPPAPDKQFTVSNLRGDIEIVPHPELMDLYNAVRGTYVGQEDQPTDFPAVRNAMFEEQDGTLGYPLWRDVVFSWVRESLRAQRLATMMLKRHRQGIVVKMPCNWSVFNVTAMEVIGWTIPADPYGVGWTQKPFRVLYWKFAAGLVGIDLFCQEEAAESYDYNFGLFLPFDPAPDTSLRTPFLPPDILQGLSCSSGDAEVDVRLDGTVMSRIKVSWTLPADIYVTQGGEIEIEVCKSALSGIEEAWRPTQGARGDSTQAWVTDVQDGEYYDVRARAKNSLRVVAFEWAYVRDHKVLGKSEPPSRPDALFVSMTGDGTRKFDWTHANAPRDIDGYDLRWFLGETEDWNAMEPINQEGLLKSSPYETTQLPGGTYTFAIKSVDTSGNESLEAAFATNVALTDPPLAGAIYMRDERGAGWDGTKTDCFIDSGQVLRPSSSGGWDDLPDSWDLLPSTWDTILPSVSTFSYETAIIDVGNDFAFRPVLSIHGSGAITASMRTASDAEGSAALGAKSYVAIGQVTASRYVQFRITITGSNGYLDRLMVFLDAPSVTDYTNDLNIASQANNGWFFRVWTGHFLISPKADLSVISSAEISAIQAAGGGFSWELVNKNANTAGTTITPGHQAAELRVYDSVNNPADAVVDVIMRGPRRS